MSSPDTNLEKQKRWHRGPLIGMAVVVAFGVGLILFWLVGLMAAAPEPNTVDAGTTPAETSDGNVTQPQDTPTPTVDPQDPQVQIEQ